jgi:hypothetical protein
MKKRPNRIRQTKTPLQNAIEEDRLFSIGYWDALPEFLHISIALIDFSFDQVREDLLKIKEYFQTNHQCDYNGTLSQLLGNIDKCEGSIEFIEKTCYKESIELFLAYYGELFAIKDCVISTEEYKKLQQAYIQISDRHDEKTILCKHIVTITIRDGQPDPTGHFQLHDEEFLLSPRNLRSINTLWMPYASSVIDFDFSKKVWTHNYFKGPFIPPKDSTMNENKRFEKLQLEQKKSEFEEIVAEIRKIQFLLYYERPTAEVIIGFISRITTLCIDTIELVLMHKGEIAEATLRLIYESRIKFLWLVKKGEMELIERFRDYKVGREKHFITKFKNYITPDTPGAEKYLEGLNSEYEKVLETEGKEDFNTPIERGDVFSKKLLDLALEVDKDENILYEGIYQRTSDIVHGNWRIIEKYHLEKSQNPLQNGLLSFNENKNKFAGILPAYLSLVLGIDTLKRYWEIDTILIEKYPDLYKSIDEFHNKMAIAYYEEFGEK